MPVVIRAYLLKSSSALIQALAMSAARWGSRSSTTTSTTPWSVRSARAFLAKAFKASSIVFTR